MSALTDAGGRKMIWDSELDDPDAKRALTLGSGFEVQKELSGEWVTVRFKDGAGHGVKAEGALLAADILELVDGQQMDLHLAGDKWRVW